jgi:fumarylacetoacetate (FAA) hydrolase
MRLCMFSPRHAGLKRGWPGRIEGDRVIQLAAQTLQSYFSGGGKAREHAEFALDDVVLRPPVLHPPSVRNFEGLEFRFSNPASIYGPEDEIPCPEDTDGLLYGLQIAAVIGGKGAIGGVTIMNDWRARELTPAKDTDFATSIGPVVVTLDELGDAMVVRINGEEAERRSLGESAESWEEILGRAAQNTRLMPGDLIGVGKAGSKRKLEPGDVVELEVEGIGVLRNAISRG